jgi:hypothetical protein
MSKFSPVTFLHINDHHIGTPRSYRFRPAINRRWAAIKRQISEIDADLLLVGGDLTRDGDTHEFEYQLAREDLEMLPLPFFVIPGNMDVGNKHTDRDGPRDSRDDVALNMTSARLQLFASYFGPINWSFLHKGVRFTGFFAAVAGSGLREEERFWRFMERLPDLPPARYHVAMMHYWLYMDSLDEPNWDITQDDQYPLWYFGIDEPHRSRIFKLLKASNILVAPSKLLMGFGFTKRPRGGTVPSLPIDGTGSRHGTAFSSAASQKRALIYPLSQVTINVKNSINMALADIPGLLIGIIPSHGKNHPWL